MVSSIPHPKENTIIDSRHNHLNNTHSPDTGLSGRIRRTEENGIANDSTCRVEETFDENCNHSNPRDHSYSNELDPMAGVGTIKL